MLTINVQMNDLRFKDISKDDLIEVLKLYNQNEINIYATGIDRPMSLEDITQKYLEVLVNSHEFFVGVFQEQLIGVIKGRIEYDNSEEAWISSILIDSRLQRKGIGTDAAESIMKLLQETYGIRKVIIGVLSGNRIGRGFWKKLGFHYVRTIQQYIKLNSEIEDFVIMEKDLEK